MMTKEDEKILRLLESYDKPKQVPVAQKPSERYSLENPSDVFPTTGEYVQNEVRKAAGDVIALGAIPAELVSLPMYLTAKYGFGKDVPEWAPGAQMGKYREYADYLAGVNKNMRAPDDVEARLYGTAARMAVGGAPFAGVNIANSVNPFATAVHEALSIPLSSLGSEWGRELTEDMNPAAQVIGETAGAMAGSPAASIAPYAVAKGAKAVPALRTSGSGATGVHPVTNWMRNKELNTSAELIKLSTDPTAMAKRSKLLEDTKALIPSANYTLDQVFPTPVARAIRGGIERRNPKFMSEMESFSNVEKAKLHEARYGYFPETPVYDAFDPLKKNYEVEMRRAEAKIIAAKREVALLAAQYSKRPNKDIGNRMRDKLADMGKAEYDDAQASYTAYYNIGAKRGTKVIVDDVRAHVKENIADPNFDFQQQFNKDPSALPMDVYREFLVKFPEKKTSLVLDSKGKPLVTETKPEDIKNYTSFLQRINAEIGKAPRNSVRRMKLVQLKEAADAGLQNMDEVTKAAKDVADTKWREYNAKYVRNLGGRLLTKSNNRDDIYKFSGEALVDYLTMPNQQMSRFDDYFALFGDDPEASQLLAQGLFNKMLKEAKVDEITGTSMISPTRIRNFVNKYAYVLDQVPELKQTFLDIALRSDAKEQAVNIAQKELDELSRDGVMQLLNYPPDLLDTALDTIIKDPVSMSRVANKAKMSGKDALADLRNVLANKILDSNDPVGMAEAYRKQLEPVFGKKYYDALDTFANYGRLLDDTSPSARSEIDIGDKQTFKRVFGVSPEMISARYMSVADKRAGVMTTSVYLLNKLGVAKGRIEAENEMMKIIANPSAMEDLVKALDTPLDAANLDVIRNILVTNGVRVGQGYIRAMEDEGPGLSDQEKEDLKFLRDIYDKGELALRLNAPMQINIDTTQGGPKRITTQQEFDELKSGEEYIDPEDGQPYRKP